MYTLVDVHSLVAIYAFALFAPFVTMYFIAKLVRWF